MSQALKKAIESFNTSAVSVEFPLILFPHKYSVSFNTSAVSVEFPLILFPHKYSVSFNTSAVSVEFPRSYISRWVNEFQYFSCIGGI